MSVITRKYFNLKSKHSIKLLQETMIATSNNNLVKLKKNKNISQLNYEHCLTLV